MASGATQSPSRTAGPTARVAWYRFRATFLRRWPGYLALAVLIGLAGGVALASLIGARRTESSYPQFLASTNPSDLLVNPNNVPDKRLVLFRLGHRDRLPHVHKVEDGLPVRRGRPSPRVAGCWARC